MRKLILLLSLLPLFCFGQAPVVQQKPMQASGPSFNKQVFSWSNGVFINNIGLPIGTNATLNNANPLNGYAYLQLSDTTLRAYYNGSWLAFGGGGGSSGVTYFSGNYFAGHGTLISPITWPDTIKFDRPVFFQNRGHIVKFDSLRVNNAPTVPTDVVRLVDLGNMENNSASTPTLTITNTNSSNAPALTVNGQMQVSGQLIAQNSFYTPDLIIPTGNQPDINISHIDTLLAIYRPGRNGMIEIRDSSIYTSLGGTLKSRFLTTADLPAGGGYTPETRTLTINGTPQDLSANRTWTVGTVTSVSGITNRITSTGGTTPAIDISATFEALLEKVSNKATGFGTLNNTLYPTTQAVANYVTAFGYGTGTVTSVATGNGLMGGTITTAGTLKADTAILQTILNFFPKADTRYYTKTGADARYQPLEDQRLSTTNSPSFVKASLTGTAGGGYLDIGTQSASPGSVTNHLRIYSDSLNRLSWKNSLYRRTIQVPYPSDYTIRMPYLVTGTTLEDSTHAANTYLKSSVVSGLANPTGTIGFTAVNGTVTTGIRSDGSPKADSTVIRSVANSYSLSGMQTKLNNYVKYTDTTAAFGNLVHINGTESILGQKTFFKPLTINANTGSVTVNFPQTPMQVIGADGQSLNSEFDSFGDHTIIRLNRFNGTRASRTKLLANNEVAAIAFGGATGTSSQTYEAGASHIGVVHNDWSATDHSMDQIFKVVKSGDTVLTAAFEINQDYSTGTATNGSYGETKVQNPSGYSTSANTLVEIYGPNNPSSRPILIGLAHPSNTTTTAFEIDADAASNTSGYTIGRDYWQIVGSTSANKGGNRHIQTKKDGGALTDAIVIDQNQITTFGGAQGIAATATDAAIISNTTASTSGVAVQESGALNFGGHVWNTTTPADNTSNARMYLVPISGATPSAAFNIDFSLNGGAYNTKAQFFSSGSVTLGGGTGTVTAGLYSGNVSSFGTTSTDASVIANTTASTSGVPVQYSGRQRFHGTVWNTTATAANNLVDWGVEVRPVSGTAPSSAMYWMKSLVVSGSPSFSDVANLTDAGKLSTANLNLSGLTASSGVGTDASKNLVSINVPQTQASADLTAQTTAGNVATFTVGASTATFNISQYINVTAVSVDVIQGQITYTDENNTAQTISLQTLSAIGNSTYSPVTIRAKNGTVITVKTNLTTGAGSITFDAGARITQL